MLRAPCRGPVSPLLPAGLVLTAAGLALYVVPRCGTPLFAVGAFVLAVVAAVWVTARHR
ncbi:MULTISPECIES: hypothetical protein [unclassified Streptomyces]|uniref:hypothetical protein n=1 Tax=unclassified Streptomyces TaxID=2593676 RepID=UPI002E2BA986|nr:hypothetical protein [Streptomyces sp. NBC_01439]